MDTAELCDSIVPVKTFILDTCVLLHDPNSIFAFKDDDVVIPLVVIEELDDKKTRDDDLGVKARRASRLIDSLVSEGDLVNGVTLANGGILYVKDTTFLGVSSTHVPKKSQADDIIIELALSMMRQDDSPVYIVTRDTNLRIKCFARGILTKDYSTTKLVETASELYRGVTKLAVESDVVDSVYAGDFTVKELKELTDEELFPNHIFVLKSEQKKSVIVRYDHDQHAVHKVRDEKEPGPWKLRPRNKEQNFALDLLMNKNIQLVTLVGSAGTGKTLLAIAAGLGQVMDTQSYKKLIVTRPIQPLGNDLGYLPGSMEEKMAPWISPIMDNLKALTGKDDTILEQWMDRGILEIEAITYIRGRSIPDAFMIIDEAQNLSSHELKTIITRAGSGTKIVLTGDIEQIDNKFVDSTTNGLAYAVEKFKAHSIAGHVSLIKGERSPLASLAAKIL